MNRLKLAALLAATNIGVGAAYGANVITYYNFDQTSTPFVDQVGPADVTFGTGATSNTDSPLGDTLGSSFSSTSGDSAATQANSPSIGTDDFSISFWMNLASSQSGGDANGILDMLANTNTGGLQVLISPSDNIALGVGAAGNSFQNRLSSAALSASNFDTWTHIAITVDRDSATGITYYVNGSVLGTSQDPTAYDGISLVPTKDLDVGSANGVFVTNGLLDDLAIYTGVLTSQEVSGLAAGTLSPSQIPEPGSLALLGLGGLLVARRRRA
ncbi:MAG: LamG domain-containing protein [Planctomycetota bacterium]